MYDRLLLPTDGSDEMEQVVGHAAELARVHDASIHVVYVVDTTTRSTVPIEGSLEGVHGLLREEGSAALAAVDRAAGDVDVDRTITEGEPGEEILSIAEDGACDLVVMGTHGRGGLNRLLLGSVAESVLRRSPVPVLTVRVDSE